MEKQTLISTYRRKPTGGRLHPTSFGPVLCLLTAHSIKATAAHIAFDAPSRSAVDAFFLAALKAGGRIHGEPAVRDQETGYYSAAIIDLDDNSIEAMHRDQERVKTTRTESIADDHRVLEWQKDVAKSTVSTTPRAAKSTVSCGPQANKSTARIIVNNVTAPAMVVSRSTAQIKDDGDMSAKSLIGTLLGAAAGAAVAYAMTKGEAESLQSPITQTITYQTVDAAETQRTPSTASSRRSFPPASSSHVSRNTVREIDYPQAPVSGSGHSVLSHQQRTPKYLEAPKPSVGQVLASTLIETFIPPTEVRHKLPHAMARSQTDSIVQQSRAIQDFDLISQHSRQSRRSSAAKTVTMKDFAAPPKTLIGTEAGLAKDIPLPISAAASSTSRHLEAAGEPDLGLRSELGSVAPSDSVSQAGSRRSKTSKRSSRHGHSKLGRADKEDDNGSRVSEQTVRYRGSKSGGKRDSAISLPMRPSSKAGGHRSVKSFITGM